MKVLVTGGARSGKSTHAEQLVAMHARVTYVATGTPPDGADPDWQARVAAHQARRPDHWTTLETRDLALAVTESPGAVLLDSLGSWLTALVDDVQGWERPRDEVASSLEHRCAAFVEALEDTDGEFVVVTEEVGLGIIPETASGRLFRDLLGTLNQRVAAVCDEVHLVVAGRVLTL
ncbi:MAG: cobU [Nocardioidaceae bacterium]|nr:cobU [Nocardioidaceae bacterium]